MNDENISADKLYKILHYSKRKTKYLLDNGIIPSIDTGKKTWRYQVKMSDVQFYLSHKQAFLVPVGMFNAKTKNVEMRPEPVDMECLLNVLFARLENYPDALTVAQAADASLFSEKAICDAIANDSLYAENVLQVRYIPKQKLIAYTKNRIKHGRLPLCKPQMELLNKLTEERKNGENDTKSGRKNDGELSGCTGCRRRNKNIELMQNESK